MSVKTKASKKALDELELMFGKGAMAKASDKALLNVKDWFPSGSLTLDLATGGGVPRGCAVCIIGRESASKTTLALSMLAESQKKYTEEPVAFLDAEGTLDLGYAEAIGVDLDRLTIIDIEEFLKNKGVKDRGYLTGEEWLDIAAKLIGSRIYSAVVLDSLPALLPAAELNSLEGGQMNRLSSLMSRSYRTINGALTSSNTTFIYLNQYRMNPGGYGNPYIEPGGEAWKYLQSLKLEITKKLDKDSNGVYGIYVHGKVTKSKVSVPYKEFNYYVEFGKGIIQDKEIFDLCLEFGIIAKKGSWFILDEDTKLQGEDTVLQLLQDNPELFNHYKEQVLERIKTNKDAVIPTVPLDEEQ